MKNLLSIITAATAAAIYVSYSITLKPIFQKIKNKDARAVRAMQKSFYISMR